MYLNKYDIKGETFVKLDELNDMMKSERCKCMKESKAAHKAGDEEKKMRFMYEHGALIDLGRKINMSENGEKFIIFCRDAAGRWEYFMQLVKWDDIPEFVRRHLTKKNGEYAMVGTNEIEEATLFECEEDVQDALASIEAECKEQVGKWHIARRLMFDTKENRESLLALFYNGGEDSDSSGCHGHASTEKRHEKAEAIKQAEEAIDRTRNALDKTEKLLSKLKDGEVEKPSEAAKKPSKRKAHCPGRYTVWYRDDGDTTQHCMGFVRFEKGIPVFTNRPCKATWFTWKGMAENVAERCGDGFEVVDMIDQMTAEERLLRAIFREDGMDGEDADDEVCEWHGDGVRAEDEDWDGDDDE